jgi:hypothetical protein
MEKSKKKTSNPVCLYLPYVLEVISYKHGDGAKLCGYVRQI